MLEVKNLYFKYNKKDDYVINDVSFKLEKGKIGVLLGKNGVGKTTLLKLILGLLKPEKGEIYFDNNNLKNMKSSNLASIFSYVPQQIDFGKISVYEAIMVGRISKFNFFPSKNDKKLVESVIKEMNLESKTRKNVDELSGGEKQKVAIARALVQEPKVIIFDEPTGNLDLANEKLIINEAKKIANKGVSVLISIHDLNLAFTFGETFYLLKEGKIIHQGGKEILNEENLKETYDINLSIKEIENKKFIYIGED